ncbi:MAG TPA: aldo/keto reductase [Armatimonadota bacterium]|nr:aldo/keto reductase [Armatimonadota bacterium]
MLTARLDDLALSRLMLGTVQLGMPYGIANRAGQPSYEVARDIIACAYEGGVTCFDTAAAYGASEQVLGQALAELGLADRMTVATKIRPVEDRTFSDAAAREKIEGSVAGSLRALRLEALPLCLFHREHDFRCIEHLLRLKEKGLVRHVGASVMTPKATAAIIGSGLAEAVQLPASLLDHRFARAGILTEARRRGVAVFARSIYLQGSLLMSEREIPSCLEAAIPVRRELEALAREAGMSLAELAARYVLSLDGVTCVVIGMESVEQLRENLTLIERGPLAPALCAAIGRAVPELPDDLLMPNRWQNV